MARRFGATEEDLRTLDDLPRSALPEGEKEGLRFAEKMTLAHGDIGDEDFAKLSAHWETDQIVELLCVIGLFNYLNRFAEALALSPTQPGEGGPDGTEGEAKGE